MKIAIVNDLPIAVEALRRVLLTVDVYQVVWVATNGAEAVQKCATIRPDLILMDLLMPVMDGVEATRWIMKTCPCAILLVTSSIQANLSQVFAAMCYGALDVVLLPSLGSQEPSQAGAMLLRKIITIAKLIGQPKHNLRLNLSGSKLSVENVPALSRPKVGFPETSRHRQVPRNTTIFKAKSHVPPLVTIGASAGGPKALASILSQLPRDFGAAIAIGQHIDAQFAPGLANWLDRQTPLSVELAAVGASPQPGKVLIAGKNDHLVLRSNLTFDYSPHPQQDPYRPSVNALFNSMASHWPSPAIAILLTGMGADGALGLKQLRSAGWHTIAQDRQTCAVYGMPKAALELGAAGEILPLSAIAPALLQLVPSRPQFVSVFD